MSRSPSHPDHTPLETVRLNARDRKSLLKQINTGSSARFNAERRALRVEYDVPRILFMPISPSGNVVRHAGVPRNLSKRGLAFVLGRFVYPDTECKIAMPALSGDWIMLNGVVRACRHIGGIFHETAVVFDEPIDLREFADLTREQEDLVREELAEDVGEDAMDEAQTELVLVVDDDKANRRLLTHFLTKLGLRSREATGAGQAVKMIKEQPPDAVLIDIDLGDADGLELVQSMRGKGFTPPIICVSSDDSDETQQRVTDSGCNGFLAKPFTEAQIKAALEGAMSLAIGGEADEPLYSTFRDDESMDALLRDFVKTLNGLIAKLGEATGTSDYDTVERVCQQIKGSGGSYGFDSLSELSVDLLGKLQAEERDLQAVQAGVSDLIRTLRRVRA